jgi:hypothetical protein
MWIPINRRIDLILSNKWPITRKALSLFELQVAFHLADGPRHETIDADHRLRVEASKLRFHRARVLAASKLMEHLDNEDIETRDLLRKREFEWLMDSFRFSGGFKTLRISDPKAFDAEMDRWAERARNIGILADISLRLPPPELGSRRKNRITTVFDLFRDDQDKEMRERFKLTLGRTKLIEYYRRYKQIFPFAYSTYRSGNRARVMRPLRIYNKQFAPRLLTLARSKKSIIHFCARYNEVGRRLNARGYNCQLIIPPEGITFPEVQLSLEPWPDDIIL